MLPLAQVVVHFMADPVRGLREMARVTREGHLGQLFRAAGLHEIEESSLSVSVRHPTFEEWWEPFTSALAPPAPTRRRSTPSDGASCANDAERCCQRHRSS
jgi:hypothetical protein